MHKLAGVLFALGACAAHAATTGIPSDMSLQQVASGLSSPVAVRHAGDARLFIVEQGGAIKVLSGGNVLATPFLRIAGTGSTAPPRGFTNGGERGLLGLAFPPNYAASGQFYISYTDGNGDTLIARYLRSGNPDVADASSGAVILRIDQDFANHNGGDIHFGPDGYLYIGMGDGGDGNDPCNRAQTLDTSALVDGGNSGCAPDSAFTGSGGLSESRALLGKLLRIDVSGTSTGVERCGLASDSVGYTIPPDNPYAGSDGRCGEIFHAGLRNPFRFSFDRDNGDLWIGDVGQGAREEIDYLPAGTPGGINFGWRCREGFIATPGVSACTNPPVFRDPVLDYDRGIGQSITGGFRSRGPQQPLNGLYFFGDFVAANYFVVRPFDGRYDYRIWRTGGGPSSFGEDVDGNVYVVQYGGSVHRIVTSELFADGMEDEF